MGCGEAGVALHCCIEGGEAGVQAGLDRTHTCTNLRGEAHNCVAGCLMKTGCAGDDHRRQGVLSGASVQPARSRYGTRGVLTEACRLLPTTNIQYTDQQDLYVYATNAALVYARILADTRNCIH